MGHDIVEDDWDDEWLERQGYVWARCPSIWCGLVRRRPHAYTRRCVCGEGMTRTVRDGTEVRLLEAIHTLGGNAALDAEMTRRTDARWMCWAYAFVALFTVSMLSLWFGVGAMVAVQWHGGIMRAHAAWTVGGAVMAIWASRLLLSSVEDVRRIRARL